ncbi:MAG: hypothetical protein M3N54_07455 [Acidobacteriota bacterium]|nr:hypothetical protein [Acidobacteriota bacterium]
MKTRAFPILIAACSLVCLPVFPAEVNIQGPVIGYFADTGGIHAISGVPGSATVGPVLASDLEFIWIAPDSRTALGIRQGMIFLLQDVRNTAARVPLMQWTGPVDSVLWSGDSTGALIYSSERGIFQTATGLPSAPSVNRETDVTGLGGQALSFRLSGKPWNVALIVKAVTASRRRPASMQRANSAASLYLFTSAGTPILVRGISLPGPMDFSPDAQAVYVVDKSVNQLMKVSVSTPDTVEAVNLHAPELVPGDFSDLAVSPEGQRIFVLDKQRKAVCGFAIASGNTTFCSDLDFSPAGMKRLAGSLYLLDATADPTAPLWILDSDPGRTFFVPLSTPLGGQR